MALILVGLLNSLVSVVFILILARAELLLILSLVLVVLILAWFILNSIEDAGFLPLVLLLSLRLLIWLTWWKTTAET